MSKKTENLLSLKIKDDFKKSSKFIKESLIIYSEEKESNEFFELMKNGYMEMAKINLDLSCDMAPTNTLKYKFDDISEYEKWLCGV